MRTDSLVRDVERSAGFVLQGVTLVLQGVMFVLQGVMFVLQGVMLLLQGVMFVLQGVVCVARCYAGSHLQELDETNCLVPSCIRIRYSPTISQKLFRFRHIVRCRYLHVAELSSVRCINYRQVVQLSSVRCINYRHVQAEPNALFH
jgi:hypothetical protein